MSYVVVETKGAVAVMTMNRPESLNALSTEVLKDLETAVDLVASNDEILAVVLTGAGKAFVAGADIAEMKDLSMTEGKNFAKAGVRVFRKIEMMDKPVIAAVNGFALGGGCELAMSCDIRIASAKAKFGQPEVGLGILPGFAGTQRMPRLIGTGRAKELIYTGKIIDAAEAEIIGLVNQVVEPSELLEEAVAMAEAIASKAPLAVQFAKEAINLGVETDIETGMAIEMNLFGMCFATKDQKEGMDAFIGKRKAIFTAK